MFYINKLYLIKMMKKLALATSVVFLSTIMFASAQNVQVDGSWASVQTQGSSVETSSDELDLNLDDLWAELDAATTDTAATGSSQAALNWGYSETIQATFKEVTGDAVVLNTPVVKDDLGNMIKRYKVTYSTKSIAESDPTELKEVNFDFEELTGETVDLALTWLNTTAPYYFVIVPVNKDNNIGENSKEIVYTPVDTHAAAATGNVSLADVTYTYSGNEVSLKWTPVEGASKVEVYMKADWQEDYTSLGSAKMADGSYNFSVTAAGSYYVKLVPTDDNGSAMGQEIVQTVKIDSVATEVAKAPKVGPETNILIALTLIAVLGYGIYRYRAYQNR